MNHMCCRHFFFRHDSMLIDQSDFAIFSASIFLEMRLGNRSNVLLMQNLFMRRDDRFIKSRIFSYRLMRQINITDSG